MKKRKDDSYKWMLGVLDTKTHTNIVYLKNLNFAQFESALKEMKKKFR